LFSCTYLCKPSLVIGNQKEVKLPEMPTRDDALALVREHTQSESLIRHMLAVETCVRWYAKQLNEEEDLWGIAALLHDFDYEQHPNEHPKWGMKLLTELGYPEAIVRAIASHAPERTGIEPASLLERYLFACDELSGFITAVTYVRPSKSIHDVEVKSVKKKLKEVSFAAGVNRDDVNRGVELVGIPLDDHIANMIEAMRQNAIELGLQGIES
jgi:putative nucleotidyltransferase with HDIG domain